MKITSLIKSKLFSIFSHKILFCSLLLIFASFSLFGVEYKTKSSSSTLSWFDESSWQDIDGDGTGDIPNISGNTEVEIYLNADMVAKSSDENANAETQILKFNESGTNEIHIYFNGHTFDVKNAIKVGSNTTSQVFTSTKGKHGNLYLHGKGDFYVEVLEFGQDAKGLTDWWQNYPENKIYLDNGLEFYVNQHVSPYHCIAVIDNPEGTKFYLNASGMNLNWYNECQITFTKDPTPYGEQTFYKITEDGKNPTLTDGKRITFYREIDTSDSSTVENTFKYKVEIIEKDNTNTATWTLGDIVLSSTSEYSNSISLASKVSTVPKVLKSTGTVDVGDGIIITFRTPDGKMDMCEIRYIEGELLWTGAASTNISDTGNWSYDEIFSEGVLKEAIIGSGAVNYPEITGDVTVSKLTVKNGARITVVEGGVLTVNDSLIFENNSKIDASAGKVVFTGTGTEENPNFEAKYPEFSSFGTLEVTENATFETSSDLHITTALTNNGSFSAGKVYFEINETSETATITGKTGDSSDIAEKTKIAELYCENQANKNLKIINAISVGNIYISGKQDTDGNRLSVTGGTIYLENDYEDAKYLVLSDDLPTIKNGYITASKSKVEITDKPAFSAKNWKYDDGGEYPVWKGTEDNNWNNENNWNFYGVPTADTNDYVVISADGHSPIISSEVEIKKLLIQDGANLSLDENGKLTISESLNCAETGNIDASAGTVIFTGKGTAENPSFVATYPEFSKFGTIEVASGTFNLNYPLTLTQLNIASGAIFSTSNELVISSIENSGDFSTTADLHITKSLTNNGTFQAEKVYLEPSENEITITGQSGDSSDIANKTKISELYCINQAGKNLVINNAISVGKIALSGSSDNRLSIIGNGVIYLETECGDDENDIAQYLNFDESSLPKIENQYITVSDGQFSSENNDIFVDKHWINGDAIEYKWVGGASGNENNWNERTNWNIRKVPGEDKNVIIPACQNPPILAGQSVTVKTIENNGTIDFAGSTVKSDSITNNGTVKLTGNETFKKPDDTKTSLNNGEASTVIYYGTNENAEFVWGGSYEKLIIEEGFSGSFAPSGIFQSSTSFSVANSIEVKNGKVFTKKDATKDYVLALGGDVKIENKRDSLTIDSEGEQNYNFDIEFEKSVVLKSNGTINFPENSEKKFKNRLTLETTKDFSNTGNLISENGDISITSANFENAQSSELSANTGKITISATGDFTNAGTITAAGTLVVNQVENFTNSGNITAYGVEIDAIGNFKNEGSFISENGDISIISANFENTQSSELSANTGKITISTTGDFTNAGNIDSSSELLKITAKSITTSGEIKANSGDFESTEAGIAFAANSETTFEAGLVVTSAGNFENCGNITAYEVEIEATGNFTNSGTIDSSTGFLKITAKSITTSGEIKANSGEFISTESDILFGENFETTFEAGLTVTSAGNFENCGNITAYEVEIVAIGNFKNEGSFISENSDISITSASFENAQSSEIFAKSGKITISATGDFTNAGKIDSSSELLKITAKSITTSGEIKAQSGDFESTESDILFAENSENTFEAGLVVNSATNFENCGTITALGVEIEATGNFKNEGSFISENGDISITSASFENAQSSELSAKSGKITISATSDFINAGTITAAGKLVINPVNNFTNTDNITAFGVEIDATSDFSNSGKIDSSSELLKITAKSITTSGEIKANSGEFISTESDILFGENSETAFEAGLTVSSAANFENDGSITAYGIEIVATRDFTNSRKLISENGDINITSASFENAQSSELSAKSGKITISATSDFINAGTITAESGAISITAKTFTNAEGKTISAKTDFSCEITDIFTNVGTITAGTGDISIKSANFENAQSSEISADSGKMTITATSDFINAGNITAYEVEIGATGDFTNSGKFDSSTGLLKITAKSITTSGEIKAQSGELTSKVGDVVFAENSASTFIAGLTVTSAGNFENDGSITAYGVEIGATGDFTNSGNLISENGDINITSANFENSQSSEISANTGKMTITATSDFTNSGNIDSSTGLLKITAKSITTSGEIKANSGEFISTELDILFAENSETTFEAGLTVTSAGKFENYGAITASEVEIVATGDFTNSGKIDSSSELLKITAKSITTSGEIKANSGEFISTESDILFAENSASTFIAGLTVTSAGNFENYGAITAFGVEIVAIGNFKNEGSFISENGDINITSASFENSQSSELSAKSGKITISSTSDVTNAGTITAAGNLVINQVVNFTNSGTITALGVEIEATGDFKNEGNLISENGDISIKSANFENASLSELSANKDFVCNVTESFSNAGIITSASGKVDINTKSFINKNYNLETPAKIKTENGLINVTTSNFENSSDISAYLDFTCAEPEIFTNAGTITSETGKIDVKAQIMENHGSLFAINGKIDIFTELFETTKEIFGKNIDINSQSSIFAGLVKSGAGDIYISSDLLITHPVEFCLGGSLIIGTVKNPKNLVISSLDKNQNATEVKFSQNDDLESIETKVIVSGYAIIFNGNVTLSTNIDIANDFVLLNGITSGENSIYRDSITEIDGLFAYNLLGRGVFDFIDFPSDLPFSIEDNKLTTKTLSHEKYNTHFSIAEGKIISVGKNFYCNGVDLGLNTSAEWFLKIPGNDVATSAFAECYNASIKNCKVVANTNPEDYAWLSTENAKDETGNTNVAFSKAVLSSTEVSTISDNIIFIKFIDELNGKEIKIENSCNEISAWLENFRFNVSGQISEDNPGIQFTGVYANPECTESTDGKGDLSTFYLKYEIPTDGSIDYRWNTDAIGNSYGSEESTDSSGNYKKVIPNIAFERALTASYAGLRDEHKNRLVSVGTDDIGSNPLFTETKDKASPVLIAVTLGQEQHETDASSQHHYDSHNFIDWQFSEPVEFENYPKNGISQIDSVDTSANSENIQATATFGKITNQGNGFVVAGLGSFSSGKITTGSKTGLGEVNAFYRNFALDVDEKGNSYNPKIKPTRLRLSIAGYVEEENPINYKGEIYNNWLGFIDSKNTTIPSGTFTMPSSISTSIIDKRGNRGEAMEQTVFVNDFLNRYDKEKTLYGTWDIDSPVVSSYMKENLTTIEFEEVIPVDFSQSLSAQGLEIHFLDNSSYNQFEGYSNWKWRTKIGWLNKNESTEITLPLDNKGGSRMTFAENKTGGGLRLSSIIDSIEALSCKNLDLEKTITFTTDFSQSTTYEAFFGKSEDLAFDVPYLSLRFSELSKEFSLNNNYELLYSRHDSQGNPIGFITDLAGNLLYDFTVNSPDKNPPKIFLSIGAVHKDKLYIMFSKKLDWKDSNGNADEGKLRRIVKSLSVFDSKGNDTGLIDYKKGSRTKIVTETEKSTGIEISLTRTISYEELKNLYIGVNVFDSRDELIAGDGDKSKEDSISGEHGNFSMLYDLYENPASKDLKHCLSDFAVNALDVLYAYDGRVADEAILAQGVYGGNQWTVTNFTENKDNSSQIISDKDISIVSKIKDPSSFEKQDKFSMIADISPNLQSTGSDFEIYTTINPRLWFTDYIKFFSTEPNNSENIEKDNIGSISGKIENIVSGDKNQNITFVLPNHPKNENSLGWGAGNEIQFLFKVFDKDGNPLMVDGNQDGDFEDDVDHPLFAVRLKDENDLTSIDLWSLNIVDILRQKGGVTILNNVINPLNSEECAIEITIPKAGNLTVQVLTLDGNVVKVIQRGRVEEGTYYYKWNGKNISGDSVARGMYFIRVVGPNIEETRKVMVVW